MGAHRKKCRLGHHADRMLRSGEAVECMTCGDRFPCAKANCGHYDCGWVRSGEMTLAMAAFGKDSDAPARVATVDPHELSRVVSGPQLDLPAVASGTHDDDRIIDDDDF